ncbi:MAG TPA: hypothetical protein VFC96_02420 [Anaerovoracaceae bacterium]|nr:hypothetical protein [Anaerovoracaceae bacterium]
MDTLVIVSARSLIEGFNVPETDIGIIVASNTSVRQRIQTIGRLLRKGKEKNKVATIYVLYIHETVDEIIYGKADWDNLLGMKRNRFFLWDEENGYIEQAGPPRGLLPNEKEIKNLKMADEYPGGYEGIEYSCDSSGNVYTSSRQIVINPQGYPELVKKVKGSYGRFKVTPVKKYVLVIVPQDDEWIVKYAGQLQEPFRTNDDSKSAVNISGFDFSKLKLGDPYPHQFELTTEETVYFKQSRGRYVLARRKGRGEQFARIEGMAEDQKKGADATQPVVLIWS